MKKKPFTLLELSAAMAVLMIFMMFVMRFYNASQDVMNRSTGKTDQYERARIVMDMLANDLQNIYYTEGLSGAFSWEDADYGENEGTGDAGEKYTKNLSFPVLRPQTTTGTKTDLAYTTYSFVPGEHVLKMGTAGDDETSKWSGNLSGSDLGILAEGVVKFRIYPYTGDPFANDTNSTPGAASSGLPACVRIELTLMDGDSAEAYKNAKDKLGSVPDALNPAKGDAFSGKGKLRTFSRLVEIDRGQY